MCLKRLIITAPFESSEAFHLLRLMGVSVPLSRDLVPPVIWYPSPAGVPNPRDANVLCGDIVPLGVPNHR